MVEESFPRGGIQYEQGYDEEQKKLKKLVNKKRKDVLFGTGANRLRSTTNKKMKHVDDDNDEDQVLQDGEQDRFLDHNNNRSMLPLGGGACSNGKKLKPGQLPWIEPLSFAKLGKGMKLLACCREVHEDVAVFSLPNMWSAYMLLPKGSPPLDTCLQVHQVMTVQIVKAVAEHTKQGVRRRIEVTCAPDGVNPSVVDVPDLILRGRVKSVEDHGIIVDLGLGRNGFLPFSRIEGTYSTSADGIKAHHQLHENRILDFVVHSKPTTKVVPLKLPESLAKISLPKAYKPTLTDLQPGTLLETVTLEKCLKNGLGVTFCGNSFRGAVELVHLGAHWLPDTREESTEWRNFFEKHPSFQARIIAVDPRTKIVRLSLLPHLLALRPAQLDTLPQTGEVVEDCTVLRVDHGLGALLALPDPCYDAMNVDSFPAIHADNNPEYEQAQQVRTVYVHISKTQDDSNTEDGKVTDAFFAKQFAPSTTHTVRIISTTSLVEGIVAGATAPSIVNAVILSFADLIPGRLFKGVPIVRQMDGGSLQVDLGMGVRGLIPSEHLFDQVASSEFRRKVFQAKYAVGAQVDVRVLTIDAKEKRCILTAKKTMVKAAENEVICDFADAQQGQKVVGFISKISDQGLFVSFFGKAYGKVTAKSLAADLGIENHKESYNRGDAVTCWVSSVLKKPIKSSHIDSEQSDFKYHVLLSLRGEGVSESNHDILLKPEIVAIRPGAVVPAKSILVVQLCPHRVKGESIVPGYAVVRIKSKYLVPDGEEDGRAPMPETIECKLPYDQLLDSFDEKYLKDLRLLDDLAKQTLRIGKKSKHKGVILTDPKKLNSQYANAVGAMATVSLREDLIQCIEEHSKTEHLELSSEEVRVPFPGSYFFPGAVAKGYVVRVDPRHGAFVRFLGDSTGLIPAKHGGLLLDLFSTVDVKVVAVDDTCSPPRLLLQFLNATTAATTTSDIKVGEVIDDSVVESVSFTHLRLRSPSRQVELNLHCTMAKSNGEPINPKEGNSEKVVTSCHPFFGISEGDNLSNLKVCHVKQHHGALRVEVTNLDDAPDKFVAQPGKRVTGIISGLNTAGGIFVLLGDSTNGRIPTLEVSNDLNVVKKLAKHYPVGSRVSCVVLDSTSNNEKWEETVQLSLLLEEGQTKPLRPKTGDLVLGRINKVTKVNLRIDLRGDLSAYCCVTELSDRDDWRSYPLGSMSEHDGERPSFTCRKLVQCRVIAPYTNKTKSAQVSMRASRLEGDMKDDPRPEVGATVPAYVIETKKIGCFVRLSRQIQGRAILKELSDGFVDDPAATFPAGRLIAGMVKSVRQSSRKKSGTLFEVDLDLRESMLNSKQKTTFEGLEIGTRHKGTVTRVEDYGVFVKIENSNLSGLVHISECSDDHVKSVADRYSPGDLVKVVVITKHPEKQRLGFSMKSSHFINDESDSSSDDDDSVVETAHQDNGEPMDLDSDDENFASKLAKTVGGKAVTEGDGSSVGSSSDSDEETSESESDENDDDDAFVAKAPEKSLDTNVGFDWTGTSISRPQDTKQDEDNDSSSSESETDSVGMKTTKRSRKKQAERRRQEKEIAKREAALADGTADENPETAADFERLLASHPNSSEMWMRFMAFHLSLSDVNSAREVANRAFDRIEFRLEREKLNVWCALLVLELKFGSDETLQSTLARACQHNNPKHVHLRMCEMLEIEAAASQSPSLLSKADDMYKKTCKKFRDKKKVWIAYMEYLLKNNKQEDALALSKRAMMSLKTHKHIETMSKFAQLMFQYSSAEKARTIFDGLLRANKKRLDLLFVYVDKEVKHGDVSVARKLFERVTDLQDESLQMKLADKQMKRLFKKWFAFEEEHGTEDSQNHVKEAAQRFIEQTSG